MALAQLLDRLVRFVPGIAGYQNREDARETDKAVRLKLAGELDALDREVEREKRRHVERGDLGLLPKLELVATKLDKLSNLVRYAARGYRGVFAPNPSLGQTLERLCEFDVGLFEDVARLREALEEVRGNTPEQGLQRLCDAVDDFEKRFQSRNALLG